MAREVFEYMTAVASQNDPRAVLQALMRSWEVIR